MSENIIARDSVKSIRRQARGAMALSPRVRVIQCPIHGGRARFEDVFVMNNWTVDDSDGLRCDPYHPYCFGWCKGAAEDHIEQFAATAAPIPDRAEGR
jgi:hypothetical protein